MARRSKTTWGIAKYERSDRERVNNPPVGLATLETDRDGGNGTTFTTLISRGPARRKHTSFDVPTASLRVHGRIDRHDHRSGTRTEDTEAQGSPFSTLKEHPPHRQVIEFHRQRHHWTNRLSADDNPSDILNHLMRNDDLAGQARRSTRSVPATSTEP